jgi:hypothetical protein
VTISWRTATGLTAAVDTATPFANLAYTLPTGHTTNDVLICVAAVRPYTLTVGTPTDYTARGAITSGVNTANGVGVGSSKVAAFTKIHDGSESNPASTMAAGYTPAMTAMLACYSSSGTAATWTIENTTGVDATVTGTGISATGGSLTWAVGDQIVVVSAGDDNLDTETSVTVTFTGGVTHSGLTEMLTTNVTTTGNDGSLYVYTATIDGAGTGAPTFAATAGVSGTSERGVIFLRINEAIAHAVSKDDSVGVTDPLAILQDYAVVDAGLGVTDANQPVVDHDVAGTSHSRPLDNPVNLTDSRAVSLAIAVNVPTEQIDVIDTDQPTYQKVETGGIPRAVDDQIDATDTLFVEHEAVFADAGIGLTDVDEPLVQMPTNAWQRLIEEDCEFTDSVALSQNKPVGDSIGITDVNQPRATIGQSWDISPDEIAVQITDSLHVEFGKYQSETGLQITDADQPDVHTDTPVSHSRPLSDPVNLTDVDQPDVQKSNAISRPISDTVRFTDGPWRDVNVSESLSDGAGVTDSRAISRSIALSDTTGLTDSRSIDRSLSLSDRAGLTENPYPPDWDKTGGTLFYRTVEGNGERIGITDVDEPTVDHFVPSGHDVPIDDEVSISDESLDVDDTGYFRRGPSDRAGITDSVSRSISIGLSDGVGVTDRVAPNVNKGMSDRVGITDTRTLYRNISQSDSTGLSDSGQPDVGHEISGSSSRTARDDVDITDEISITFDKVLTVEPEVGRLGHPPCHRCGPAERSWLGAAVEVRGAEDQGSADWWAPTVQLLQDGQGDLGTCHRYNCHPEEVPNAGRTGSLRSLLPRWTHLRDQ